LTKNLRLTDECRYRDSHSTSHARPIKAHIATLRTWNRSRNRSSRRCPSIREATSRVPLSVRLRCARGGCLPRSDQRAFAQGEASSSTLRARRVVTPRRSRSLFSPSFAWVRPASRHASGLRAQHSTCFGFPCERPRVIPMDFTIFYIDE
jgi:hypothetical protein